MTIMTFQHFLHTFLVIDINSRYPCIFQLCDLLIRNASQWYEDNSRGNRHWRVFYNRAASLNRWWLKRSAKQFMPRVKF